MKNAVIVVTGVYTVIIHKSISDELFNMLNEAVTAKETFERVSDDPIARFLAENVKEQYACNPQYLIREIEEDEKDDLS